MLMLMHAPVSHVCGVLCLAYAALQLADIGLSGSASSTSGAMALLPFATWLLLARNRLPPSALRCELLSFSALWVHGALALVRWRQLSQRAQLLVPVLGMLLSGACLPCSPLAYTGGALATFASVVAGLAARLERCASQAAVPDEPASAKLVVALGCVLAVAAAARWQAHALRLGCARASLSAARARRLSRQGRRATRRTRRSSRRRATWPRRRARG